MEKRWHLLPINEKVSGNLKDNLKINQSICSILVNRGIDTFEKAKAFFRPTLDMLHSPWLMKDMEKAVERIDKAIHSKEKILVFGDYDVDGTTAVASFYQFISSLHNKELTDFYIPNRYKEGYGISKAGIDFAYQNGFTLIVCLDCGIKSVELIDYAKSVGIDFIVCDHHLPGTTLPAAVAILNPKQIDCLYPFKELCGCGVGLKLMMALAEKYSLSPDSYLCYLDLLATAIAADIVPIIDENRVFAYFGLKKINENPSPGMKALMILGGIKKAMSITNVVFVIAPRVNAAGRMDDARKAVLLFIEKDEQQAMHLAEQLQSDNSDRKETDTTITAEALEIIKSDNSLIQQKSCVLYREHWHKGVVGIVASRVIEHYYRPTIILTKSDEVATGSARSVKGFNLYEAIYECREYLLNFGGHFAAAGLTLLPQNVSAFTKKFNEVVSNTISDEMLIPEIVIDAEINLEEIKQSFFNIILQMEPYGPENMRPLFLAKNVSDTGYSKLLKDLHIKFDLIQNNTRINGIGFNMADKFEIIKSKSPFDIVFSLDENEWNGNTSVQLKIIDVKLSQ